MGEVHVVELRREDRAIKLDKFVSCCSSNAKTPACDAVPSIH